MFYEVKNTFILKQKMKIYLNKIKYLRIAHLCFTTS